MNTEFHKSPLQLVPYKRSCAVGQKVSRIINVAPSTHFQNIRSLQSTQKPRKKKRLNNKSKSQLIPTRDLAKINESSLQKKEEPQENDETLSGPIEVTLKFHKKTTAYNCIKCVNQQVALELLTTPGEEKFILRALYDYNKRILNCLSR